MTFPNQQSVLLAISPSNKTWALVYLPASYNPSLKYPVVFQLHGVGEVGSTEADLQKLCNTGLTQLIANGMKPQAQDKLGNVRDFIVISPQAASWSYGPDQLLNMIPDAQLKWSIDPNFIFVAGLSAGGCGAWQCTTNTAIAKIIAGIVPLSPAGFDATNSATIAKANNLAVWSACGDQDPTVSYSNALMFVNNLVAVGLPARFTTMKGQQHTSGAWNPPFQLDFASNPNNTYGENVWQWMLNNSKSNTVATPTTTTTTAAPAPTIPVRLRAENFTNMQGIQTEPTSDTGGGKDVGYIDAGDFMDYQINVPTAGTYQLDVRVSSPIGFGAFEVRDSGGNKLVAMTVPNTGGWQNWTTVSTQIALKAGVQTIRIFALAGSWNINWLEFKSGATTTTTAAPTTSTTTLASDPLSNPNLGTEIASVLNKYSVDAYLGRADYSLSDYIISLLRATKNLK